MGCLVATFFRTGLEDGVVKVTGEATVGAPAETVWAALHDQTVLARAVPGCEQLEITGPGSGRFILTTTMTAISGTYAGVVTTSGQQEPSSVELTASASGAQGAMTAEVTLRLTPAEGGATLVSYEASGEPSGALAGVGARLLASAARRLADEFLASLDEEVARAAEPVRTRSRAESAQAPKPSGASGPSERKPSERKPDQKPVAVPASPGSSPLDPRTGAMVGAVIALLAVIIFLSRRHRRSDQP